MESSKATDLLSIGNRIKELRKEKGYEQKELAELLGVSREQVNYWENGKRDIKTEITVKLSQVFNVSTDYLLGLSDAKTNDKDMQYICDYTGLSAQSIGILNYLKDLNSPKSFFIDHLIKTKSISKIAEYYYRYIMALCDFPVAEFEVKCESEKLDISDISFQDREQWSRNLNLMNLILFECQQYILDNIKVESAFLTENCKVIIDAMYASYHTDFDGKTYKDYIPEMEEYNSRKSKPTYNTENKKANEVCIELIPAEDRIKHNTDSEDNDDLPF